MDAIFEDYNTVLGSPRLGLPAIKNVQLKMNCDEIPHVVIEELLCPRKLANKYGTKYGWIITSRKGISNNILPTVLMKGSQSHTFGVKKPTFIAPL